MIPLCLVTGFLGSGKTTLLKQITRTHRGRKLVYLVNEFSPQDVDGHLLEREEADVVAVPGGSIFCKCLVVGFLQHLKQIPQKYHTEADPVEGVVIEASGIADPRVVEEMLSETGLDSVYRLARIFTVVDPGTFLKLIKTLPNIHAQVEAADVVLLNKTDMADEEKLAAVEAALRDIRPRARILRTVRCEIELDLFAEGEARDLSGEYAQCADPNYGRLRLVFTGPVDPDALIRGFESAGGDVYRAKGFVPTAEGARYLDVTADTVVLDADVTDEPAEGMAVIVTGGAEDRVADIFRPIDGVAVQF